MWRTAPSTDGERQVPPHIWELRHFQSWLQAQKSAGNRLDGFEPIFEFRVGPGGQFVFFWGAKVNVYVRDESRNKDNEIVISRPDIMHTVLLHQSYDRIKAVMVREFRSPAATPSGFIVETPGGSSFKPGADPLEAATTELFEETGLRISPERFVSLGARQLMGTMSAHKAHIYAAKLSDDDMTAVEAGLGKVHGNASETERTYIEVFGLEDLLANPITDWSTLGMVFAAANALGLI